MSCIKKSRTGSYCIIAIGTFLMALGTRGIYEPMSMVTGGFSGIGIILEKNFGVPVSFVTLLLNIPLFLYAKKIHGKEYIIKSLYAMLTFSAALALIPSGKVTDEDYLMASLLGGVLNGTGIGLVFLSGGSTGGTDLLSTLLHSGFSFMRLADILGIVDGMIVAAGMVSFGIRAGLYAIVAVFVTSKVLDGVTAGMRYAKVVYIISDFSEKIAEIIMNRLERGVTSLHGNGMYSGQDKKILMCVVSRKEAVFLAKYVKEADQNAFVIVEDAREVLGEGFRIED